MSLFSPFDLAGFKGRGSPWPAGRRQGQQRNSKDAPGFKSGVCAFTRAAEPGVGGVPVLPGGGLVLALVRDAPTVTGTGSALVRWDHSPRWASSRRCTFSESSYSIGQQ